MTSMNIPSLYQLYLEHPCITTDSRNCPAGSIFLALKGPSFNGNHFARQALESGCAYAIVDEGEPSDRIIKVDDCLQIFKDLARHHRRQFHIPVIAITGTNGKTTTKELVAAVLRQQFRVMATEGNFNNDIGVPKTLFRLSSADEIAVVEMGASHPGDIRTLAETAEPTHGIITNVGRAHLEGFGSFEGVKNTKGELYDFLARHASSDALFVNADDADLLAMARQRFASPASAPLGHQYAVGKVDGHAGLVEGKVLRSNPFLQFAWRVSDGPDAEGAWHTVSTNLVGAYNIHNALAAIAIGHHFGVAPDAISQALALYQPSNNRSQLVRGSRNTLIVDAYNANPTSMRTALESFAQVEAERKMAILGDMRELGASSSAEHQALADYIAAHADALGEVWLVGKEFQQTRTALRCFTDTAELRQALAERQPTDCTILVKGSNGMRLFELTEELANGQ